MDDRITLRGPRVTLRPPRPEDAGERLALGRDAGIVRMFGGEAEGPLPALSAAEAERWLKGLTAHPLAWVVEHEGRLLGEIRLDGLNRQDARACLAIGFFDPDRLGQGLGREAVRLLLGHAFGALRLHRVDLRVLEYNLRAIRCYRACGFVEEGREREAALVSGRRHDDVIMSILAREFRG